MSALSPSIAALSTTTLSIAADHPALPGHFPDHPIVPGVVILDHVIEQLRTEEPEWLVKGLRKVKFLQPLLPAETFTLNYSAPQNGRLKIICTLRDAPLLEAVVLLEARPHRMESAAASMQ